MMIRSQLISVSIINNNLKNINKLNNNVINNIKCNSLLYNCSDNNNNNNRTFFKKIFEAASPTQSTNAVTKEMTKVLNYSVNQVYSVVLKVEEYEEFLPFCIESNIVKRKVNGQDNCFEAELVVGQGTIKESYTSKVVFKENDFIESTAIDTNLFHKLINRWSFKEGQKPNTCIAQCKLIYHFKSPLYATLMENFFASSLDVMINSFEKRCGEIYNNKTNK